MAPLAGEPWIDLFLLIDDASNTSLDSQLEDLRQFVSSQPPTTAIGIGYMRDGTVQVVQNPTTDHPQAAKSLRLPLGDPGASASPYFFVSDLIERWPETSVREILMISDGIDRYYGSGPSDPYVDTAIEQAQRAGITMYSSIHLELAITVTVFGASTGDRITYPSSPTRLEGNPIILVSDPRFRSFRTWTT